MAEEPSKLNSRVIDPCLNAQMAELIAGLDLAAEFDAEGSRYSEFDELGQVIVHLPGGEVVLWQASNDSP